MFKKSRMAHGFLNWWNPRRIIFTFFVLQALDVLTTVSFLRLGVTEANPVVNFLFRTFWTTSPLEILVYYKLAFTVPMVAYVVHKKCQELLEVVNFAFFLVVLWNMIAIFQTLRNI